MLVDVSSNESSIHIVLILVKWNLQISASCLFCGINNTLTKKHMNKCENPECFNIAGLNSRGTAPLRYCSSACRAKCNSTNGAAKRKQTCLDRYGATTNLTTESTIEKIKKTNLEKYGVEHPMKSDEVKQSLKDTKQVRYGDATYNNRDKFRQTVASFSPEVKEKIVQGRIATTMARYGKEHVTQTDEFKERSRITSLAKYGTENPASSDPVKEKISKTMRKTYGRHYSQQHIPADSLDKLSSVSYLEENKGRSAVELATELGVTYHTVVYAYEKYGIDRTFDGYNSSIAERDIVDFIERMGVSVECHDRKVLDGKEIDIYIPSHSLAIEYNGVYWHSEKNGKGKNYHLDKTISCNKKGVRLIHITDCEWNTRQDIVKSRLAGILGRNKTYYARKCELVAVSNSVAATFFEKNHIQGRCNHSVAYGLEYNGELVACMSFARSRFSVKYEWELVRFANTLNTTVVGGAGKLFSHFVKSYLPSSVVSYCDLRWNTGGMYSSIGFTHVSDSQPNYWYTKNYTVLESRMKYQKHKLVKLLENFAPEKTEWENMSDHGYDRMWDCGNSVYLWEPIE